VNTGYKRSETTATLWKQTNFGRIWGKEEQGMAYLCVSSGKREIVVYVWKQDLKTAQTDEEDKTAVGYDGFFERRVIFPRSGGII
jgi:hypothetical protein